MARILITGGSGFVAPHLVQYIASLKQRHEIYVLMRQSSQVNLEAYTKCPKTKVIIGSLDNAVVANRLITKVKPDKIFHLAAHSFVRTSFDNPTDTLVNNIIAELNIFEALRDNGLTNTIVHIAGSSEEYGLVLPSEVPITENQPLRPLSPYGVSKIGQEMLAYQYFKSYGIKTVLTRAFNHEGPGRGRPFFLSNICAQIADAEEHFKYGKRDTRPTLLVGDLSSVRDITHVKDMVRAYWLATELGIYGEAFNIGTGEGWRMAELLHKAVMLSEFDFNVVQDPARMRPSDVPILIADATKFKKLTGWQPEYDIDTVVKDTLEYWRSR